MTHALVPTLVQLHFEDVDMRITTMFSAEGESVELIPHMYPKGNVEAWLGKVKQRSPAAR